MQDTYLAELETVNHPANYKSGGMETIDVIEAFELDFSLGNAVKYILRAGRKSTYGGTPEEGQAEAEDLHKARWYLIRAIDRAEAKLKELRTANEQPPGPQAPAGGNEKEK